MGGGSGAGGNQEEGEGVQEQPGYLRGFKDESEIYDISIHLLIFKHF